MDDHAAILLEKYSFPGNIRQLKNIAEQVSIMEEERMISAEILHQYLPNNKTNLPAISGNENTKNNDFATERDIMYKILFDMRNDINDLKKLTLDLMQSGNVQEVKEENQGLIQRIYEEQPQSHNVEVVKIPELPSDKNYDFIETIEEDESLSLHDKEIEMIKKSLERNRGKRKLAAKELGISERTLYRKIKQYDL